MPNNPIIQPARLTRSSASSPKWPCRAIDIQHWETKDSIRYRADFPYASPLINAFHFFTFLKQTKHKLMNSAICWAPNNRSPERQGCIWFSSNSSHHRFASLWQADWNVFYLTPYLFICLFVFSNYRFFYICLSFKKTVSVIYSY